MARHDYAKVWHGNQEKTSGGLTKDDLMKNKWGRIVSKKRHKLAKKRKTLIKLGFLTEKGKFGLVKHKKKTQKKKKNKGRKKK